ncbi:Integrase catalytic core [Arabidopsis thaliana x Arabidopsis arenosa]|uniref:Integrase catalytic core n=1 Tax=Arabidopsis thaliana x Arabidopsis arenosa TaxID=1240361 RepID=A0A8T2AYC9_9BRAS|nr:Integrase catalytic core [Arabidopsis thaliana x Arabidopsis arenosa]
MAITRAQDGEPKGKDVEVGDPVESRISRLEELVAEQHKAMMKHMTEMFGAMSRSTPPKLADDQSNLDRSAPMSSQSMENRSGYSEQFHDYRHHPGRSEVRNNYGNLTRLGKIDFPRFDGTRIKEWLFKVEEFFGIDRTPEDLKVKMAAIHLDSHASTWHQSFIQSSDGLEVLYDWKGYVKLLKERFEDESDDPMAELKKLQETGGIVEYHQKFELIKTRVNLSEEYLVSIYLAGLRMDTQMHVKMFQPKTVRHCFSLGRMYEKAHPTKLASSSWTPRTDNGTGLMKNTKVGISRPEQAAKPPFKPANQQPKRMSQQEMSDRRAKGLCYFCDEKYTPEHYLVHRKTQLFCLDVDEEFEDAVEELWNEEDQNLPQISVNAVSGISGYRTMRVKGTHDKKTLFILIDSGSTHNFIDSAVARTLGCKIDSTGLTRVSVADGRKLKVDGKITEFTWKLQSTGFQSDILLIPLQGIDMVLGVQWLETLGRISWEFKKLEMRFKINNQKVLLHGLKEGSVREVKAQKLQKLQDNQVQLAMLCVQEFQEDEGQEICSLNTLACEEGEESGVDAIVSAFPGIFEEPTDLPPFRAQHDHKIKLLEGSNPVNQRPYRYAVHQKNEIDKIVEDMLQGGTIQVSSSPYASPVVLVKKKDGTWRLCVDYRELNGMTVKDRFPIPLIEDLMDELGGSSVYSKIDLRAGYHQVRMDPLDIHKTAFKTHSGHYEYLVMPFGLTNAPATFQSLMNSVFKAFLRKFVLVFFDDILIYSSSLQTHVQHLQSVFELMQQHQLFAKRSKCAFAVKKVEYLGHFISAEGIATDPAKLQAVREWPIPVNLKQLRGFLGLAGYYRRFVKSFGTIAGPLHALTKTDAFVWSVEAQKAFEELKDALCNAPVLALPMFDKQFVVETDACGQGIGAVLMQEGHPLAYISRQLKGKQLHLSIYEKELLAVIFAVRKWRHYLLSGHFIIKTDQRSLKYLLEQRLNTPIQQQWLPKLLEFDYEIQYRQGKENLVADALSRVEGAEVLHMALSLVECDLMKEIQAGYANDVVLQDIITALQQKPDSKRHYSWVQGILRRKSKIVIPSDGELKNTILQWLHCSGVGGHSGRDVTHQRVKGLFYWKGMVKDIQSFIRSCGVCQQCKGDNAAYPGLLQPLPIPEKVWSDVSMDFIDGLPVSAGKSVIMVVVDRLSKAAHFIALAHPYSALSVAQAYLDNVFKLHGCPNSIVSDRDSVFTSEFWKEFFSLQGVTLKMTSAYHPQSDGQTEVVNRCLETYLRCMCHARPEWWSKWLALAEYWYNTNYHSSTRMTPFEVVYGQPPPVHLPYLPGESKVAVVARSLQEREQMILFLKFHLMRAQHRMKQFEDQYRTERNFDIGDFVYVKLQPYRQNSVVLRSNQKLAPKYYGPYKIIDKCGEVAYKLQLPTSSQIHPVFHVSQLKILVGNVPTATQLPSVLQDVFVKEPEVILERKMVNRQGRAATKVLVKWFNEPVEEATWEFLFDLQKKFPDFVA